AFMSGDVCGSVGTRMGSSKSPTEFRAATSSKRRQGARDELRASGRRDESMKAGRQTTLRDQTLLSGVGVHSGLPVTVTLHPADAGTGIRFVRTGLDDCREREICADIRAVTATEFATVLGDASGPLVSTAEHVLAALRGLGVDNT